MVGALSVLMRDNIKPVAIAESDNKPWTNRTVVITAMAPTTVKLMHSPASCFN